MYQLGENSMKKECDLWAKNCPQCQDNVGKPQTSRECFLVSSEYWNAYFTIKDPS